MAFFDPTRSPRFTPPHCPNPTCKFHDPGRTGWKWTHFGFYCRTSDNRQVRRFRCLCCNRTFSTQTFSTSYWLKRFDLFLRHVEGSVAGSCLRQLARKEKTTHTTVARHLARAGRQSLLFHAERLNRLEINEPVAVDGFETFEYSQFHPFHIHLGGGTDSWFLYAFTDSPLRRKGRMTVAQKARREELEKQQGRPDPKAIEKDMAELISIVEARVPRNGLLELRSDDHPAYVRSLRRLELSTERVIHVTVPSTAPRTRANLIFAINHADLLIRHSDSAHKRETIAFAKRRQCAAERTAIHLVWRNYVKKRRENGNDETTAMRVGAAERRLSFATVLRRRLFPAHVSLPARWRMYYRKLVKTAAFPRQAVHALRYAF